MAALPVVNPIKTDTIHYIPAFYPTNSMMNLTHLERRIVFLVFSNSHTRQLHINISHEVSSLHCSGMNDDQIFFSFFCLVFFFTFFTILEKMIIIISRLTKIYASCLPFILATKCV
jgi:hypothetical protein